MSGTALVNDEVGKVIGLITEGWDDEPTGYAIPIKAIAGKSEIVREYLVESQEKDGNKKEYKTIKILLKLYKTSL